MKTSVQYMCATISEDGGFLIFNTDHFVLSVSYKQSTGLNPSGDLTREHSARRICDGGAENAGHENAGPEIDGPMCRA